MAAFQPVQPVQSFEILQSSTGTSQVLITGSFDGRVYSFHTRPSIESKEELNFIAEIIQKILEKYDLKNDEINLKLDFCMVDRSFKLLNKKDLKKSLSISKKSMILSALKVDSLSSPSTDVTFQIMPSKGKLETASFHPFQPGDTGQSIKNLTLSELDEYSASRDIGSSSTANTRYIYRTIIDGNEFFVKRVSLAAAMGATVIENIAKQLGLGSHILPSTYIENPSQQETAFLLTPMVADAKDVETQALVDFLGETKMDFLARLVVFDHIIGNDDRSSIKQLITDGKDRIYLIDNDASLDKQALYFQGRVGDWHIIEQYAREMQFNHKDLKIPKELIAKAKNLNIDELVMHYDDKELKARVKSNLDQGIIGIKAIEELESPTLGDLCQYSPTMDKLSKLS